MNKIASFLGYAPINAKALHWCSFMSRLMQSSTTDKLFHFCIIAEDCHVTMTWNKFYKHTDANVTWVDSYSIVPIKCTGSWRLHEMSHEINTVQSQSRDSIASKIWNIIGWKLWKYQKYLFPLLFLFPWNIYSIRFLNKRC